MKINSNTSLWLHGSSCELEIPRLQRIQLFPVDKQFVGAETLAAQLLNVK